MFKFSGDLYINGVLVGSVEEIEGERKTPVNKFSTRAHGSVTATGRLTPEGQKVLEAAAIAHAKNRHALN